jgi:hypothetical protein
VRKLILGEKSDLVHRFSYDFRVNGFSISRIRFLVFFLFLFLLGVKHLFNRGFKGFYFCPLRF